MKFLKLFEEFTREGNVIARVSGIPIKLTIASTESEMTKGYMNSNGPSEGEGMLFVYPKEEILSFWMRNVTVPLDILFFDSNRELVDAKKMYPYSEGEEEKIYYSSLPAKFALELPHGWVENYLNLEDCDLKFE